MLDKLNLKGKVIVHCGACEANEMDEYDKYQPSKVLWVEAIPRLAKVIEEKAKGRIVEHIVVNKAIYNKDNEKVVFNICNQPWASSLLELGADVNKHWSYHEYVDKIELDAITIDTLLKENGIRPQDIGVLILDLQGAEVLAFEGAVNSLKYIPYIVSEIVYVETYKDGPKQKDVDSYLKERNFVECDRKMHGDNLQGDAMYRNMNNQLFAKKRIAYDSKDHLQPWGTAKDNTICPAFVDKITKKYKFKINFLDLGCAGGGLVKEFYDKGHLAIGLEGSDFSQKSKRAEWSIIPNNLHTCDIIENFYLTQSNFEKIDFDIITAWEVLEHIKEIDIPKVLTNIYNNLKIGGYFICSISGAHEFHHETVKSPEWWAIKLNQSYFSIDMDMWKYIHPDWVRDNTNSQNSFHFCVQKC